MKANEGMVERALRVVAGLAILSLFFVIEGPNRFWALLGAVPLVTGLVGYCPLYALFALKTCPMKAPR
jgi:hypothetical protein